MTGREVKNGDARFWPITSIQGLIERAAIEV
jgi:hypothetical protein